ncbi:enoyl-CoA hydratase [Parvibium lacunae]|uniref:Enoyl-CoA hydratase n=2 Tax=Parvibium lacunae TaxID=1888893 RepID=A0A368KZU2_9BURK|nr:enoyl-CoA hydratase [Parvibium lacunae]RCS56541.1 enoyl-CoA hydratase [Parvibium lacunae]
MDEILINTANGVCTIQLNRPARKNALTAAMYQTLADSLRAVDAMPTVRVVLLQGHPDIFTAGNDIEDFLHSPPLQEDAPVLQFLAAISTFSKPLMAAVSGPAVGIGTTLLLHCDLVYASETAMFALPFSQLGLCPEAAASYLLPRLVGHQRAAEKLFFGESFTADEALDMGLVNRVVAHEGLLEVAQRQAERLAALPSEAIKATKALLREGQEGAVAAAMQREIARFQVLLHAPEAKEAFTAFMEKRKPNFNSHSA